MNLDTRCAYCGEYTEPLAGNPGKWPLHFSHADGTGLVRAHHTRCVTQRLEEWDGLLAENHALRALLQVVCGLLVTRDASSSVCEIQTSPADLRALIDVTLQDIDASKEK